MRPAALDQADTSSKLGFPAGVPDPIDARGACLGDFPRRRASGKPRRRGRVGVLGLHGGRTHLPDDLVDRMASQTGPDGRVILRGVPLDQIREVRVSA